jgi:hypothetical protein
VSRLSLHLALVLVVLAPVVRLSQPACCGPVALPCCADGGGDCCDPDIQLEPNAAWTQATAPAPRVDAPAPSPEVIGTEDPFIGAFLEHEAPALAGVRRTGPEPTPTFIATTVLLL